MIETEEEFLQAMRDMIRKVQDGYEPTLSASAEEREILAECIRRGYLYGAVGSSSKPEKIKEYSIVESGRTRKCRVSYSKILPVLYNHVVSPYGLALLTSEEKEIGGKPDKAHCSKCEKGSRKKFYQSGNFWAAAAIFVTIATWAIDRFILAA